MRTTPATARLAAAAALAAAALFVPFAVRTASTQPAPALATAGDIVPISTQEATRDVNNGYPSLLRDRGGHLWLSWISARRRDPLLPFNFAQYEEGDAVMLRVRKGSEWSGELMLNTNFGVNLEPELAVDGSGHVYVFWSSRRNGEYGIYYRRVAPDMTTGTEQRLVPAGALEGHPAAVADRQGRLWLATHAHSNGSMNIAFYRQEGSGWQRLEDAAATPDPEFRPRLAAAPDGSVWCAWDTYHRGKYRVALRRYDPAAGRWGTPRYAPGDGVLDVYAPDIAVDSKNRVWLVYARNEVEEHQHGIRGPLPGQPPRPTVRLVVHDGDAWLRPEIPGAESPGWAARGDLPRIAIAPDDSVWVVWQFLPGHMNWKVGARLLRNGAWSAAQVFGQNEPVPLDGPANRADQRPAPVPLPDGNLAIAYERNRGTFRNRDIYYRELRLGNPPAARGGPRLAPVPAAELQLVERPARRPPKREAITAANGERRTLYFGDLHNHLLIDDGHMGTVDQLFIFHRDRFASDFAATTSHGDSYKLLISELAQNDGFTEALLEPGRFVTIPGFEWTQGDFVIPRAGHRHVIYETPGGPLYRPTEGHSDSIREFVDLMSKTNGLIFAHHITRGFTGGTDWSYVNVKVEPAVEMCSSWGRFEYWQNPGHIRGPEVKNASVQDVWRMGWRLGVIGGSDGHNLFGDRIQGLTGVYATGLSRPAIFDAIRKRRTYATTGEPITVDFRVNGHFMGSEITAADGPLIEADVTGTAALVSVEVIKHTRGGPYPFPTVYRAPVDGNRAKVWWKDPGFTADSLYYLRVTQHADPAVEARYRGDPDPHFPSEMAWTSPVWVAKVR